MSRVIATGDVHLGAANANVTAFNAFLDDLYRDRSSIDEIVLLGDLWDLVRRDPFGVAWEHPETLSRLQRLAKSTPVRYVLGNHDICLRELDGNRYDTDFREHYTLTQNGTRIHFRHGHEFDRFHFNRLSEFLSGAGDRGDIDPTRGRKDPFVAGARDAVGRMRTKMRADGGRVYPRRERRAHDFLDSFGADKLVYGHTHAPYVHHENIAANAGSWKVTTPVHNTYIEIQDGQLSLHQYRPDGEDRRIE